MMDAKDLPAARPLILLTDRPHRQAAIEAQLAEKGVGGITVTSGVGLAQLILDRRLEGKPDLLSQAVRRRVLSETLAHSAGDFKTLYAAAPRQTLSMLLPLVEEAELEGFDEGAIKVPAAIASIIKARFRSVRELADAYRKNLEKLGADEATLIRKASAEAGKKLPWTVMPLDRHIPKLVAALLSGFDLAKPPPAAAQPLPLDRIRVYRPRDVAEEAELVAQLLLQSKIASWRDAVVIADNTSAPLLAAELRAHGISVAAGWRRSLGTTGGWSLVSSWLKILVGPFGPGDVASALLGMGVQEGRALRITKDALSDWSCTSEALRALADQDTPLDQLLKHAPGGVPVPEALEWIRKNILAPLEKRFYAAPTPDLGALRRESKATLDLVDAAAGLGNLPDVLDEALRSAPPVGHDLHAAGVEILLEAQDPGRQVPLVIATGFVRGRYPRPPGMRPVIGDPERAAAGLPVAADELLERRQDLLALIGACTGDIVFTSPQRWEGEWTEPSLFLDELLSQAPAGWKQGHVVDLGAPEVVAGPPPLRTKRGMIRSLTAALNHSAPSPDVLKAARALSADPESRDILLAPTRPSLDFALGRPASIEGISLSPSKLQTALGCRYHFFASALLRLEDVESAGHSELTALELGNLVHKVMELSAGKATPATAPALLDAAVRALYPWALSGQFGLALASLKHTLQEFIPRYQKILAAVKGVPMKSELQLRDAKDERPLFPLPSRPGIPHGIPVGGRIDQPVRLADGTSLIIDFKFGKVVDKISAQAAAGLDTQSPLYAWFLREDGRFPKPSGVLYLSVVREEALFRPTKLSGTVPAALGKAAVLLGDPLETAESGLAQRIADLLAAMVVPRPDCTPVDDTLWEELYKAGADPCKSCSYGLLCRDRKVGKR